MYPYNENYVGATPFGSLDKMIGIYLLQPSKVIVAPIRIKVDTKRACVFLLLNNRN